MDTKHRRALKQWKAEQRVQARNGFPLPDDVLEAFFDHVEERCSQQGCDKTRRFADEWLAARGHRIEAVLAWLDERHGFCDCMVSNVRRYWADNRLGAHQGDTPTQ